MEKQQVIEGSVKVKGPSRAEILTTIFVVLKLCKLINWSWLWVLSPIWIVLCLELAAVLLKILIDYTQR